ncbi:MAG: DUF1549 and DUF1553 domain-containing protein, partial [Candidatus Poribacteria bacterium]|nr:DUF1549 and DUF1553 domain-containing protein [Candidatus Poribacteria bacterium]
MTRLGSRRLSRALIALMTCLVAVGFGAIASAQTAKSVEVTALSIQPETVALEHGSDARRVLVSGRTKAGNWVDLTHQATYSASQGVRVDANGYLRPVAAGESKVTISAGGRSIDLPVTVRGIEPTPVSFVRDVMPVVSRLGCNAGTCHGAAKGKNGFKLSLRGYDPEFDYEALIQDISGRRFNRAFPDQSLMLLKPLSEVPHKGGQPLKPGSDYHNLLRRWIDEGARSDAGRATRVERLEVLPQSVEIAEPGMTQQVLVIAHYPDGTTRDVTREAVFTSSSTDVATMSDGGNITAMRRGEAAILTRYEGAYATNTLIVMGDRSGFKWVDTPEYNYIDTLVHNKLKRLKIQPSELCTDDEFARRIYFDLTGLPPTPEQARAFLADTTPSKTKREALIDKLLDDPEYVQHWTHKWADLLQCNRKFLGDKGVWLFRSWIEKSVADNKPYDKFARELLTADGSAYENPAANYYRVSRDYASAVENTTQLFLGVRFSCNKCHDHPFEKWTQNQYYELGAYFAEVGVKAGRLPGEEIVFTSYSPSEVKHPKTLQTVAPSVPYGETTRNGGNQREALAEWITSPDNPLFARSAANRLWSYFMGRGIIEPVDDVRTSNPPSNPELLDALTEDFVQSGFDMKHLMRTIARSRTYQLSMKSNRWNEDDSANFARATPKRLTAEQLLDAITVATGSHPKFQGMPTSFRAAQLPDSQVGDDGFLRLFGRPARESVCECERTTEVSLAHAMNLINGSTVGDALIDPHGRIARLIESDVGDRALAEEVYLATFCRYPREEEV